MKTDRRHSPRAPLIIRVEPLDGGPFMVAHDMSLGGMLVTTKTPRWPGSLVGVRFRLPGEKKVRRAACRVVDLAEVPEGVGLALEFIYLAPRDKLAVHQFVDARPLAEEDSVQLTDSVKQWLRRIVEDCAELKALARV